MGTLREGLFNFVLLFLEFFLEWEMFQTKFIDKIKSHI